MQYKVNNIWGTCTLIAIGLIANSTRADNPLIPNAGIADPHIHIFNNKAYLYSTHDVNPDDKQMEMPDWIIRSSDDLIHWKTEWTISPKDTYIGESDKCWAPDVATMNGKYYFYFSNNNKDAGVMVGDEPGGPFKDALGKPLLPSELTPGKEYDVSVLVDEGVPYLAFGLYATKDGRRGRGLSYYIARLNPDMISLAEEPRPIEITGQFGGNDKPDITKHGEHFYLSAGADRAIADNVYGPYKTFFISGDDSDLYGLNPRAHGKLFDWNNQSFFVWCRFVGLSKKSKYRESLMTYVHYKANGELVCDRDLLDAHYATGVGQYGADWETIEAEWYMGMSDGAEKTERPSGGFEITNLQNGSFLRYPNIQNFPGTPNVELTYSSAHPKGGAVSVRLDDAKGLEIGRATFAPTGSWTAYKKLSIPLKSIGAGETRSFTFVFEGDAGQNLIHVDAFRIRSGK